MPGQRLTGDDWEAFRRLAAQYDDPRQIEADLDELEELRQRLGALGRPRPLRDSEPDWWDREDRALTPHSVSEALALHDRGLLDDDALRDLLGLEPAETGARWWRRGRTKTAPAFLVHRLGWGAVWRFAALAGLQLVWLPQKWMIALVAALLVLILAGLPLRLWKRRNLFATIWRLAVAETVAIITVHFIPVVYFVGLALGCAVLTADLIWTVLWPWMSEDAPRR